MKSFRHTRITFTIGPATESEAQLEAIITAGADVVRLNMAHADHEWVRKTVALVRKVCKRMKKELSVMMDIKGPEIRTGARKEAAQLAELIHRNPRCRPRPADRGDSRVAG